MKVEDLNVGDRVRISNWADMLEETKPYGGREEDGDSIFIAQDNCYFVDSMSYLIGEEFIVRDIEHIEASNVTRIRLEDDHGGEPRGWTITAGMLERVSATEIVEVAVQDLLRLL